MTGQQVRDRLQVRLRIDFDDELTDLVPVALVQTEQDIQFALLNVDLEEIDSIEPLFSNHSGQRSQSSRNGRRLHSIVDERTHLVDDPLTQ